MAFLTQTCVYEIYGDVTMPDTRFVYTINEISGMFDILGHEGLRIWAQFHMLDL